MRGLALGTWLAVACAIPAAAQEHATLHDLRTYRDLVRMIDEGAVVIPMGASWGMLRRERLAELFAYDVLTGRLSPDSVAWNVARLRELTRQFRREFEEQIRLLEGDPAGDPGTTVTGTWRIACYVAGTPAAQSGSFVLVVGVATVEAEFIDTAGGTFRALGQVDGEEAYGCGAHALGGFCWRAHLRAENGVHRLREGRPSIDPSSASTTCTYGEMTQTLPS